MAAPKNGANCWFMNDSVWLRLDEDRIMNDSVWLRLDEDRKTVSSGDWSFRNNLEKFDDNPPFRYF